VRSFGSYQSAAPTRIAYILYFRMIKVTKVTSQASIQRLSPLMLENRLPLSWNTSARANVLLQGVVPGLHSVPLHHINLKSDFVSGQVVVGLRPTGLFQDGIFSPHLYVDRIFVPCL
jgi:hypothetical protein